MIERIVQYVLICDNDCGTEIYGSFPQSSRTYAEAKIRDRGRDCGWKINSQHEICPICAEF